MYTQRAFFRRGPRYALGCLSLLACAGSPQPVLPVAPNSVAAKLPMPKPSAALQASAVPKAAKKYDFLEERFDDLLLRSNGRVLGQSERGFLDIDLMRSEGTPVNLQGKIHGVGGGTYFALESTGTESTGTEPTGTLRCYRSSDLAATGTLPLQKETIEVSEHGVVAALHLRATPDEMKEVVRFVDLSTCSVSSTEEIGFSHGGKFMGELYSWYDNIDNPGILFDPKLGKRILSLAESKPVAFWTNVWVHANYVVTFEGQSIVLRDRSNGKPVRQVRTELKNGRHGPLNVGLSEERLVVDDNGKLVVWDWSTPSKKAPVKVLQLDSPAACESCQLAFRGAQVRWGSQLIDLATGATSALPAAELHLTAVKTAQSDCRVVTHASTRELLSYEGCEGFARSADGRVIMVEHSGFKEVFADGNKMLQAGAPPKKKK
jgi:hypothetical protein